MKVLLIHQTFISPEEAGGTRHFELARHCEEQGVEFTIVASNLTYLTGRPVDDRPGLVTEEQRGPVKILRAKTLQTLHRSFTLRVISFLSFMVTSVFAGIKAGPIDVVMGTSPPIFQAFSAWAVSFIRRKPLIFEVRDLWPEFAVDIGILKNPLLIWLARRLERFLYSQAAHLIVNSPAYVSYLVEQKKVSPDKITLIPNGVDPKMFDPDADGGCFREKWNARDRFVVTYAGAVGLANDIPTILSAARLLGKESDIQFMIVGDGKELSRMKELASEWELRNVMFPGAVPKTEMSAVLAASDVCLATLKNIPMFKTTYPNKVFDYMAAGRPTILCIDGVIRKVIEQENAGLFVQPGDAEGLAKAIVRLHNDRVLCKQMGANGRAGVEEKFDRAKHAKAFGELFLGFKR